MTTTSTSPAPPAKSVLTNTPVRKSAKKKPFPWQWVVIALLVAAGIGYWYWSAQQAANNQTTMLTTKVSTGNLTETVSATGSITAQTGAEVAIGSQITGVVKHLFADVGTVVKKNEVIAELDVPETQDQVDEATAATAAAATKYAQTLTQTAPEVVATSGAISEAQQTVSNDIASLQAATSALQEQKVITPTDIQKAQVSYNQTVQGYDLTIQTAQQALTQAKATAASSSINLKRQQQLLAQGFVPQSTVDQAQATDSVNQSLVSSAQENLTLTQQKVAADLPTAKAVLLAAQAETQTTAQKQAIVVQDKALVARDQAALKVAQSNIANNVVQQQTVEQAKQAMQEAQAAQNYQQVQLGFASIKSPIAGTVLQLATEQGETLNAGLSAPTLIVVADLSKLQVDAYVDETDIGKIKLGQPATVTVDAFPNHTFHGKVVKIAAGSTIQEGVVTYDVTVSIRYKRFSLKPDMTSEVNFLTGQLNNVTTVPAVAVNVGVNGSTVSVVTTVNGKQKITPVPVVTGGTDGVNTQIVSGLTPGQTIVLASADAGNGPQRGPQNPFAQHKKSGGGGSGGGGGGGSH